MRVLILDDDQERHEAFAFRFAGRGTTAVHVHSAVEAVEALSDASLERFGLAQLDHDLDPDFRSNTPNGLIVAEYIAAMPVERRPAFVVIHSWNPAGAARMARALLAANVVVAYKPFGGLNPMNEQLRREFDRHVRGAA
jgi:CheY-like chemotaxis protein